jgi:hypothetical protein
MMHIVQGIFANHLVPIMKGKKRPKPPQVPLAFHVDGSPWSEEEKIRRNEKYDHAVENWKDLTRVEHTVC